MKNSTWYKEMHKDEIILDALRQYIEGTIDDGDDNLALACEAFAEIYENYISHSNLYKETFEKERAEAVKAVVAAVTEDKE